MVAAQNGLVIRNIVHGTPNGEQNEHITATHPTDMPPLRPYVVSAQPAASRHMRAPEMPESLLGPATEERKMNDYRCDCEDIGHSLHAPGNCHKRALLKVLVFGTSEKLCSDCYETLKAHEYNHEIEDEY